MPTLQPGFHFEESGSYNKTRVLREIPTYSEYVFLYLAFTNSKSDSTESPASLHAKPVVSNFL